MIDFSFIFIFPSACHRQHAHKIKLSTILSKLTLKNTLFHWKIAKQLFIKKKIAVNWKKKCWMQNIVELHKSSTLCSVYWLKFMWNLQNTKTIMYVGTFSISNTCRYIFESADGISCPKWPHFSMLVCFWRTCLWHKN